MTDIPLPVVKVVGPSASGKSTLVRGLRAAGFNARSVTQEHSGMPDLWRHFDETAALVFLDVTWAAQCERRREIGWSEATRRVEQNRLAHARAHADFVVDTSGFEPAAVLAVVLIWLRHREIACSDGPLSAAEDDYESERRKAAPSSDGR